MALEEKKTEEGKSTPAVSEGPTLEERLAHMEAKTKEIVADRDQWKGKYAALAAQTDTSGKPPVTETDIEKASKQDLMRSYLQVQEELKAERKRSQDMQAQQTRKEKMSVVQKFAKEIRIKRSVR